LLYIPDVLGDKEEERDLHQKNNGEDRDLHQNKGRIQNWSSLLKKRHGKVRVGVWGGRSRLWRFRLSIKSCILIVKLE
jgi:hypothetical protein